MAYFIKTDDTNIKLDVSFQNHINAVIDYSGTGKTFLLSQLKQLFTIKGIKHRYIDYSYDKEAVLSVINSDSIMKDENSVLLYDNADLTIDKEIYNKLVNVKATVIICIKTAGWFTKGDVGYYKVHYANKSIVTERYK